MKTKQCPICNNEFTTDNARQIYCSSECSSKARSEKQRGYNKKYYDKIRPVAYRGDSRSGKPINQLKRYEPSESKKNFEEFLESEEYKRECKEINDFLQCNPSGTIIDQIVIRLKLNSKDFKFIPSDIGELYTGSDGQHYHLEIYFPRYYKCLMKLIPCNEKGQITDAE